MKKKKDKRRKREVVRRSAARDDWIAIGLIVAVVAIAFGNVIFLGKSLVITENANPLDPRHRSENYGKNFVPYQVWTGRNLVTAPNYRDPAAAALQTEPAAEFLRRSLARGQFPFWDPYIGAGSPSLAALTTAYLFPPSLLVVLAGNGSVARNAYILLLIAVAGVLTYKLLRDRGLHWLAATAGGIAFALSGAMVQTAPSGLGQPVAFFSLALLTTARLLDAPSARRAAQLAAAYAFVALASFPPILMQVFGICAVYAIVAAALRPRSARAVALGWFGAGAVVALAVVAVVYLPAILAAAEASHVGPHYAHAAKDILDPQHAMQLLSPTIMGGATIYANAAVAGQMGGFLYYTGAVALLLAGIGILAPAPIQARALKIAAIVAGGLAAAKIFGVPPVQWIMHVPLLRSIHYGAYFGILVAYAVVLLMALGMDALLAGRARLWRLGASAVLLAVTLAVLRLYAARQGVQFHAEGWRWIADFRLLVFFTVIAAVAAYVAVRRAPARNFAAMIILATLATEGITNAAYPRQRRGNVWRNPPRFVEIITWLGTGGRVLPLGVYPANTHTIFGHSTIDSVTVFNATRMLHLYQRYFFDGARTFFFATSRLPPERVLDAANIEYVTILRAYDEVIGEAERRAYETLYRDDFMYLMRRPTAPRYFFTSDYRVMPARAILEELPRLPPGAVLVEQTLSVPSVAGAPGTVAVSRFELNEVELIVQAPRAGLLVCSESRMNGWTATVDGREAAILPANYAFRAVEVPAGRHTVRLRYRAPGFVPGLFLSAAGLIGLGLGLRRRAEVPGPE